MTTSKTATALSEEQHRADAIQRRLDARDWLKNFALFTSIALGLAALAAFNRVWRLP